MNEIGDAGVSALADACVKGALTNLLLLNSYNHKIDDIGLTALAQAITADKNDKKALENLKSLSVDNFQHSQLSKACVGRIDLLPPSLLV